MCVHVCVAISLHKIKRSVTEIKSVIELLDVERLRQEEVDILIKIAPTEEEVCVHAWYNRCVHVCMCLVRYHIE